MKNTLSCSNDHERRMASRIGLWDRALRTSTTASDAEEAALSSAFWGV